MGVSPVSIRNSCIGGLMLVLAGSRAACADPLFQTGFKPPPPCVGSRDLVLARAQLKQGDALQHSHRLHSAGHVYETAALKLSDYLSRRGTLEGWITWEFTHKHLLIANDDADRGEIKLSLSLKRRYLQQAIESCASDR